MTSPSRADSLASKVATKAKELYSDRRARVVALFGEQTFLDEIGFLVGVFTSLFFTAVCFGAPHLLGRAYVFFIVPLLCARFVIYRSQKWHYFMIDFCYYNSMLLMELLWKPSPSDSHVLVVFALSMGPLVGAIWMWKNALVFSDLDRFTSVFIHFVPALVAFSIHFETERVIPSFWPFFWKPLVVYLYWQVAYVIKTEILDRKRFAADPNLTSSLRWMTKKHPHPIYVWVQSKPWGKNIPGLAIICVVQFVYTCVTLTLAYGLAHSKTAAASWLIVMLGVATFNGGKYYLEIMAERHAKKQERKRPEVEFVISSSFARFLSFVVFILVAVLGYRYMMTSVLQIR